MDKEWIEKAEKYLANTYKRYPLVITKGEGCWIWDINGRRFLDLIAGIAVCNLGHAHPKVVEAIKNQLHRLSHVSNLFYIDEQIRAAELLIEHSFGDKVFFCNSGAEANEAAIKLARRYAWKRFGKDKYEIIVMENSFHGRTIATLSATGQRKFHEGFEPLLNGFKFVPFNNIEAFERSIDERTCACMLEIVQSEGGVNVIRKEFLEYIRKKTQEKGILLILDEVQTGIGRTGKLFAYEHFSFEPDLITLAKALGNGFPVGALIGKEEIMDAFDPGSHASTFGGNPLASSAVTATLNTILEDHVLEHCQEMSKYIKEALLRLKDSYPIIKDVRGVGLLLGVEFVEHAERIREELLKNGIIVNCTKEKILRILPPLIIGKEEADLFLYTLENILKRI